MDIVRDMPRLVLSALREMDQSADGMIRRTSRQVIEGRLRRVVTEGVTWTVYERELPYEDAPVRSLIFDTDRAARRIRNYPAGWYALPDEELAALARSR